jgi:hypothetical protein
VGLYIAGEGNRVLIDILPGLLSVGQSKRPTARDDGQSANSLGAIPNGYDEW